MRSRRSRPLRSWKSASSSRPDYDDRVAARSAGILLYRMRDGALEVLLVHPGGPVWARRDVGVWSVPKGEYGADEQPLAAALREFAEEVGSPAPEGARIDLGEVRQKSGKLVNAWAVAGDLDAEAIRSNTFELEWPPRSGKVIEVPEVDRAGWFSLQDARAKINPAQVALIDRLEQQCR
jgi:predicted NUDIX family NTP pyrophosphohydrolase